MTRTARRRTWLAVGLVVLVLVAAVAISWVAVARGVHDVPREPPPAPLAILMRPIPDGPNAGLLRRGRYLAIAGDCVSCHTRKGGHPFAGGLGLRTPFGVIFSPNLTGDRETGLGAWTPDDFARAMSHGIAKGGRHLYPAFPYPHFTNVSRADTDAILAYLKSLPPVRYTPPSNKLPFPIDIRASMIAWNALFFRNHPWAPDPQRSAAWNRGAYLVDGLGHCGACHSPKTIAGSDERSRSLQSGELDHWVAPDLTGNPRTGLGRWSAADIAEYLRTGRNVHANAAGPMAEVVSYSTSLLSDADLQAIATYLKTLPASPSATPDAPDPATMRRGGAIFSDACASCHLDSGRGQPRLFPPLPGSAVAQQRNPDGLVHLILAGGRTAPTPTRPTDVTMPSFAWKLDDGEVADVATFVRNSWGNRAAPVKPHTVADMRRAIAVTRPLR